MHYTIAHFSQTSLDLSSFYIVTNIEAFTTAYPVTVYNILLNHIVSNTFSSLPPTRPISTVFLLQAELHSDLKAQKFVLTKQEERAESRWPHLKEMK